MVNGLSLWRSHSCAGVLQFSGRFAWALALAFHLYLCITHCSQLILDVSFPLIASGPFSKPGWCCTLFGPSDRAVDHPYPWQRLGGISHSPLLSETIGPNFEISLHAFPNRDLVSGTSIPRTSKSSRRPDTWAKAVKDPIFLASLQLFFALTTLVLALAYYWQIYVPSDTVKSDWVDVFG